MYSSSDLDLYRFIQIPPTAETPYPFYIGKYPVTNAQYERFLNAPDYADKTWWTDFPKYNADCLPIGKWESQGWDWLRHTTRRVGFPLQPKFWDAENFGNTNPDNPIVGVSWYEACAYCHWLKQHWQELDESQAAPDLQIKQSRLPLDLEWTAAAGGDNPQWRYPWDGSATTITDFAEIMRRANIFQSQVGHTTRVNAYPNGASPYGVMDMAGNVWEWQANDSGEEYEGKQRMRARGGAWDSYVESARVSIRDSRLPVRHLRRNNLGFRVVVLPSE